MLEEDSNGMKEQELTLEEIHAGTREILKKLIEVCDAAGSNYYMAYGSLLGTVRHQGFIPWDDDLDVIMLRPDYEKFRAYCEAHEEELRPFRFFDRHNTPDYPYGIGRFSDTSYRMERDDDEPVAGQGMFIDIYPYDGVGDGNPKTETRMNRKKARWQALLGCAYSKSPVPSKRSKLLTPLRLPAWLYAHARGPKYFLDRMERLKDAFSWEDSTYVTCTVWDPLVVFMKRSFFEGYTLLSFEGLSVKVPVEYDRFLRDHYGDYMQLPPVEQRVPYHGYRLYRKQETAPKETVSPGEGI